MSETTSIAWTDATWNPVRGCVKISPGCKNCYAKTFAERWRGIPGHAFERGFDPRLVPEKLDAPLHWKAPRRIFVGSMSDLFLDTIPRTYLEAVFNTMVQAPQHTFQVLTKRAERMKEEISQFPEHLRAPNIWLGVSVEDRKYGLPRIEHLRQTPAAMRFLSVEPLLEDLGVLDLRDIHWVIVGGESGPNARPMDATWVRSIRDQCQQQHVPFFFNQWGGILSKSRGRLLDGVAHNAVPIPYKKDEEHTVSSPRKDMNMNEQVKKILAIAARLTENSANITRLQEENKQLEVSLASLVAPQSKQKPSKKVEKRLVADVKKAQKGKTRRKCKPRIGTEYEQRLLKALPRDKPVTRNKLAKQLRTTSDTLTRVLTALEKRGLVRRGPATVAFGAENAAQREVEGWLAVG